MATALKRAELIDLFEATFGYCPETGVITARKKLGQRALAGSVPGSIDNGYRRIKFLGHSYRAHVIAWVLSAGRWPAGDIDHINGNRSDNRLVNLRDVSRSENVQNVRRARISNKSCALLGVTPNRRRWKALIGVQHKRIYLGTFDTAEEAHAAYVAAKAIYHPGAAT